MILLVMLVVVEKMVVKMVVAVPLEAWCGKYVALIWSILKYTMVFNSSGAKMCPLPPCRAPRENLCNGFTISKRFVEENHEVWGCGYNMRH